MGEILAGLPAEVVTGGGFAGLLFLCVWLIMTGRLVPRSTHLETRADRDSWRKAFEDSRVTSQVQAKSIDQLVESVKATETVMKAMHAAVERIGATTHTGSGGGEH